jgi:diacylglycerol kinase (ATP)
MKNPHKGRTGFDRIWRALGYSLAGYAEAFRAESAFRQEIAAAIILLPASFWLGNTWVETALLAGSVLLMMIVELLNSAIEAVVDRVSFELHDLSKRAKDVASAAVLTSLIWCVGIWSAALWHRFGPMLFA